MRKLHLAGRTAPDHISDSQIKPSMRKWSQYPVTREVFLQFYAFECLRIAHLTVATQFDEYFSKWSCPFTLVIAALRTEELMCSFIAGGTWPIGLILLSTAFHTISQTQTCILPWPIQQGQLHCILLHRLLRKFPKPLRNLHNLQQPDDFGLLGRSFLLVLAPVQLSNTNQQSFELRQAPPALLTDQQEHQIGKSLVDEFRTEFKLIQESMHLLESLLLVLLVHGRPSHIVLKGLPQRSTFQQLETGPSHLQPHHQPNFSPELTLPQYLPIQLLNMSSQEHLQGIFARLPRIKQRQLKTHILAMAGSSSWNWARVMAEGWSLRKAISKGGKAFCSVTASLSMRKRRQFWDLSSLQLLRSAQEEQQRKMTRRRQLRPNSLIIITIPVSNESTLLPHNKQHHQAQPQPNLSQRTVPPAAVHSTNQTYKAAKAKFSLLDCEMILQEESTFPIFISASIAPIDTAAQLYRSRPTLLQFVVETDRVLSKNVLLPLRTQSLPIALPPQTDAQSLRLLGGGGRGLGGRGRSEGFGGRFVVAFGEWEMAVDGVDQFLEELQGVVELALSARSSSPDPSLHYYYPASTMLAQDTFTRRLHARNQRPDGRDPMAARQPAVHFLPSHGQLLYSIGKTQVVVKVAAEISAPRQERPAEGWVMFRVDCQNCQGSMEQNRKLSIEAAKLLETVIVGSKALDPESLCILSAKYAWKVTTEVAVISDDGNVLDALLNGVVLALLDTRKPLVKLEQSDLSVEDSVQQPLSLAHLPISYTFTLVEGNIFSDATAAEERVASSRITVTMNVYKELCSIHKPGGLGISEATLSGCVKVVEQRVKETNGWLRNVAASRPTLLSNM